MRHVTQAMIIFAAFILLSAGCISEEVRKVRDLQINNVDLQSLKDGTYGGDFTYGNFTYEVSVVIEGHRIIKIDVVKNRDGKYAKKAESVVPRVLEQQRIDVDAETGATTTSKAILKAIENAVNKAQ